MALIKRELYYKCKLCGEIITLNNQEYLIPQSSDYRHHCKDGKYGFTELLGFKNTKEAEAQS